MQRNLEKAEETLSSKAEAKDILLQSVSNSVVSSCGMLLYLFFFSKDPEKGGTGPKKLSFRSISARIRGEDMSYESQLAAAEKELSDAETAVHRAQKEFE